MRYPRDAAAGKKLARRGSGFRRSLRVTPAMNVPSCENRFGSFSLFEFSTGSIMMYLKMAGENNG
jgi:hypothetical protein